MFAKNKQKLNRKDFIFENEWFSTLIKLPATLQMQQFQISDCEQCSILVADSNAGTFIDDCKYCTIFIGPAQSSIFIRDCHYLKVICMSQQFRMRDCTNCEVWLWCESQPIIQSSHDLIFYPFDPSFGYSQILQQIKEAKLKIWNNNWFNIYDFTPQKYGMNNHTIQIKVDQQSKRIIKNMKKILQQYGLTTKSGLIPYCQGIKGEDVDMYDVVVISPIPSSSLGLPCLHSRTAKCPEEIQKWLGDRMTKELTLFVKIKKAETDQWKRLRVNEANLLGILTDRKAKEILEMTVFVPFGDER